MFWRHDGFFIYGKNISMSQLTWSAQWRWNQNALTWNGQAPNQRKIMAIHVSLGFSKLADPAFGDFAVGVHDAMAANAATFTTPPVTMTALNTQTGDFLSKLAAANQGSVAQTAAKDASRAVLDGSLRTLANYVEGKAQTAANPALVTLAGLQQATTGHTPQTPLAKPAILAILNNMSGQLDLRLGAVSHASAYEVQYSTGGGGWQAGGIFPSTRGVTVTGLTPGTTYTFRVRAIGGSTGASDWSDPTSHMAT
jgi:hypothetical protein